MFITYSEIINLVLLDSKTGVFGVKLQAGRLSRRSVLFTNIFEFFIIFVLSHVRHLS